MKWFKLLFAGAGTAFSYLFGGFDVTIIALAIFMALDYLTGVSGAIINKKLSSEIGLSGIAKKSLIVIILIMAVVLDRLINQEYHIFRTLVCYFYIANEGISILENIALLGVPFPNKLLSVLKQLKKDSEKEDE